MSHNLPVSRVRLDLLRELDSYEVTGFFLSKEQEHRVYQ